MKDGIKKSLVSKCNMTENKRKSPGDEFQGFMWLIHGYYFIWFIIFISNKPSEVKAYY